MTDKQFLLNFVAAIVLIILIYRTFGNDIIAILMLVTAIIVTTLIYWMLGGNTLAPLLVWIVTIGVTEFTKMLTK